jgi:hypothetical protein
MTRRRVLFMRTVDIVVPLILILIAISIIWVFAVINPVMLPFALGIALLLIAFIMTSFCSGRYTHERSEKPLTYKR